MKRLTFFLFLSFSSSLTWSQCTADFSYSGVDDTVSFSNLSSLPNARYYWSFGDGSTSYATNPVHVFPETGNYLVTLYAKDTVGACHTFKDTWIAVSKPTIDPCNALVIDSLFTYLGEDYIFVDDGSVGCAGYACDIDCGPAQNFPPGNWISMGTWWSSALFISRIQFRTADSISGYTLKREYYHTKPYHFSSSPNYDPCSANFEFYIDYQAAGALVSFRAMNTAAASYQFSISGFGSPIIINAASGSHLYPYVSYEKHFPWLINLQTLDAGGCRDTVTHEIMVQNIYYTEPADCSTSISPVDQNVFAGGAAQFFVSTDPGVSKQWQQDAGLGFVNLSNAGPYSGVNTDTLTISSVAPWMNNYHYRCVISNSLNNCHNTTSDAVLSVAVGIEEHVLDGLLFFPNPTTGLLQITFASPIENTTIRLQNVMGELVIEEKNISGNSITMDLSKLAEGVYFVEINSSGITSRKKIVKK